MTEAEGGRVFFARARRAPDRDTEIRLVSVGIDIGSSTSHLAFSRLVLQRRGMRTQVRRRELLHESDILLTPYSSDETIDAAALGGFIKGEYEKANIEPEMIDTGALILTGVAARQRNARAIGDLFAAETGRFVAVAAGDALETMLSAHGSGAVAESAREGVTVLGVDIGGGTSKIARCEAGTVADLTAIDVGARLICLDAGGRVSRIEPAGRVFADAAGVAVSVGAIPAPGALAAIAAGMAEALLAACGGAAMAEFAGPLLRLPAMQPAPPPALIRFSGGVSAYIDGSEKRDFGDLGRLLADAVRARMGGWAGALHCAAQGIRATVLGASQYSVQLSGNTIFVSDPALLPMHNVAVIAPALGLEAEAIDPQAVAEAVRGALRRQGLERGRQPAAVAYRWQGDATHARLRAFCAGVAAGMAELLAAGMALVLVGDGDVGGLVGIECAQSPGAGAILSIDGVAARAFDYLDIGEVLMVSGGVPVVVKSLVFPNESAPG